MSNDLCILFRVLRVCSCVNYMSDFEDLSNLGLTHPSILDALVDVYKAEMYRQNIHMRKTIQENNLRIRKLQEEIVYFEESCRLYSNVLRPRM